MVETLSLSGDGALPPSQRGVTPASTRAWNGLQTFSVQGICGHSYLPSLPLAAPPSYAGRSTAGTGEQRDEQRDFRTHTNQPATRNRAPFSAAGTFAGLGAIPASHRRTDAGFCCGAVLHDIGRVRQPLGN